MLTDVTLFVKCHHILYIVLEMFLKISFNKGIFTKYSPECVVSQC